MNHPSLDQQSVREANDLPAIPIRRSTPISHWWWGIVALLFTVLVVLALADNRHLDYSVVGHYMFNSNILHGLLLTLVLAVAAEFFATIIGVVVAYGRLSSNPVLRVLCWTYTWIFRSVPTIVQILIVGNIALFVPTVTLRIPWTDVTLLNADTNSLISSFAAALIALALHDGAYNAEIFRAGISAVNRGQYDASIALGLTWWQLQRKVVLPQAVRISVPPYASQFITLIKLTSLVSVLAVGDLLTEAQNISNNNQRTIELLIVASIWFLAVTSIASVAQYFIERRLGRPTRKAV